MPKRATRHPDFARVPEHHRWSGKFLTDLRHELQQEAIRIAPAWAWRILPGGASVAMRVEGGHLQGRVARSTAPRIAVVGKWQREVDTFAEKLGWEGWKRETHRRAGGIAVHFRGTPYSLLCSICGNQLDGCAQLFADDPERRECSFCVSAAQTKARHVVREEVGHG